MSINVPIDRFVFRTAWIVPFALLAIVVSASAARAERALRIVTFNAECLAAPGTSATRIPRFRWDAARRAHLERVASLIETLDPDVLNLLEVTSKEAVDDLVKILREKGMTDYRGYHVESNDKFTGFDVAAIAKLPLDKIDGAEIRAVGSFGGDGWREKASFQEKNGRQRTVSATIDRGAVYYLTVDGVKLGFLGLHLKANPDDPYSNAKRTAETEVARRVIQKEIVARGYLPIVLGDLNDYDPEVPDRDDSRETKTEVFRRLKDYDDASAGAELVNAASKIARKADRYTSHWDRNENGALDSDDVTTMIDHIMIHRDLAPGIRRAFIPHVTDLGLSDHFPVVVDLALPPAPLTIRIGGE